MIDIRKLVAIDISFLGKTFIIAEFVLRVFGIGALGVFVAVGARSSGAAAIWLGRPFWSGTALGDA